MPAKPDSQKGYSLLELLVASVVGLALLGGLLQLFLSSRQSYRLHEGLSRLQENGRFMNFHFSRFVRLAGYKYSSQQQDKAVFGKSGTLQGNYAFQEAQVVTGSEWHDELKDLKSNSDILSIRYQGAAGKSTDNCLGHGVAEGAVNVDTFYVGENSSLYCESNGLKQPLSEGIENLQIVYGIDRNADRSVDAYYPADKLNSEDWLNVIVIRAAAAISTVDEVATEPDRQSHPLLPISATLDAQYLHQSNDRRRRKIFSTSILLRNVIQ